MNQTASSTSDTDGDLARVYSEIAERASRVLSDFVRRQGDSAKSLVADEFGIGQAYMELWSRLLSDPYRLAAAQINYFWDNVAVWQNAWARLAGREETPHVAPAKDDNRFEAEEWQNHFLFDYLKQSYLVAARHIQQTVTGVEDLSPEARKKVHFFTRQYVDALAPTNFLLTNPQAIRETVSTRGANLVNGLNNLLRDIEAGNGELRVRMTDDRAFEVGKNVATTPGKVVFRNDLMELIQYAPLTEQQFRRPLLIVPPWINKFYILDLREKNSFIRWATSQGHTVFVISWVNPDEKHAHKEFADYMFEGPLAALDAITQATGEREINAIGYCLGGTLLGATLAWMAAKNDRRIATATFFVSLLDFSIPGELGVFIDEAQVENLERRMASRGGYLEGAEMALTFNILRANDLVWSFVVNNYLLGREPMPFDLLYWNADSTRMPAKMHSFYLRNMYLNNRLREPGGIELAGVPIDLSKVTIPSYFISTAEDHIAPWKSTYLGAQALGGPVRFVLGGSGHIAGIVNPPAAKKYEYWINHETADDPDAWQANAKRHAGSWWSDWQTWIAEKNGGEMVEARVPGEGELKPMDEAPGGYVRVRVAGGKPSGE